LEIRCVLEVLPGANAGQWRPHVTRLGKGLGDRWELLGPSLGEQRQVRRFVLPTRTGVILHVDESAAASQLGGDVLHGPLVAGRAAQTRSNILAEHPQMLPETLRIEARRRVSQRFLPRSERAGIVARTL